MPATTFPSLVSGLVNIGVRGHPASQGDWAEHAWAEAGALNKRSES